MSARAPSDAWRAAWLCAALDRCAGAGPARRRRPALRARRARRRRSTSPATGSRSISEDWRWRMVTPLKGDSASIPVNAGGAARSVDAWDPAKDEAAGLQCKAYGAAGVMRLPGRVHITWQDDKTLKLETDAGTQTRLFRFGGTPPPGETAVVAGLLGRQLGTSAADARRAAHAARSSPPASARAGARSK